VVREEPTDPSPSGPNRTNAAQNDGKSANTADQPGFRFSEYGLSEYGLSERGKPESTNKRSNQRKKGLKKDATLRAREAKRSGKKSEEQLGEQPPASAAGPERSNGERSDGERSNGERSNGERSEPQPSEPERSDGAADVDWSQFQSNGPEELTETERALLNAHKNVTGQMTADIRRRLLKAHRDGPIDDVQRYARVLEHDFDGHGKPYFYGSEHGWSILLREYRRSADNDREAQQRRAERMKGRPDDQPVSSDDRPGLARKEALIIFQTFLGESGTLDDHFDVQKEEDGPRFYPKDHLRQKMNQPEAA
jgi:hypothetical protein